MFVVNCDVVFSASCHWSEPDVTEKFWNQFQILQLELHLTSARLIPPQKHNCSLGAQAALQSSEQRYHEYHVKTRGIASSMIVHDHYPSRINDLDEATKKGPSLPIYNLI
jgi:hypothetical protein